MSHESYERITARFRLTKRDWFRIVLFALGHPEQTIQRAVYDYVRGIGPAAVAAGRAGISLRPTRPLVTA